MKELLMVWVCFVVFTPVGRAQNAKDFDFNKNGQIDSGEEADAFLKHVNSVLYREIDKNKNGKIEQSELDAHEKEVGNKVSVNREEFQRYQNAQNGMNFRLADKSFVNKPAKPNSLAGFLIRRNVEDITVLNDPVAFGKASGALFGFTRDMRKDNDMWQARGVVMYPWRWENKGAAPSSTAMVFSATSLAPAIAFDRMTNEVQPDNEVDSLIFRIVTESEFIGGPVFQGFYLRLNPFYATDFDFRSSQAGGELQFDPLFDFLGLGGVAYDLPCLPISIRPRVILHLEGGDTLDAGVNQKLKEGDWFLRIGPKLELEFWPTALWLQRLSFNVKWTFLEALHGSPLSSYLFEGGARLRIDPIGHAQIELNYRRGEVPLTQEEVNTFILGINVKF